MNNNRNVYRMTRRFAEIFGEDVLEGLLTEHDAEVDAGAHESTAEANEAFGERIRQAINQGVAFTH